MKAFVLSVMLLYGLVSVRAEEDGVKYTRPSERWSLWERILPTLQNIPDRNFEIRYSLVTFEGCEFFARKSGDECDSCYWAQFICGREYNPKGEQGLLRIHIGISSSNPRTNRSLVRSTTGLFAGVGFTF
jgi:hypothetical protein